MKYTTSALLQRPHAKRVLLCCLTLAAGGALHALKASAQQPGEIGAAPGHKGVEFYVSEDAVQGLYQWPARLGELNTQMHAGLFRNSDRDLIGMYDVLVDVGVGAQQDRWSVQLGPRGYAARLNVEDTNSISIGLGGRVQYDITADGTTSFALGGFYAPDILSTGDVDNVRDVHARVEQRVTDGIDVFVGYRMLEWDMGGFGQDTRRLDDGWQLGLRGAF